MFIRTYFTRCGHLVMWYVTRPAAGNSSIHVLYTVFDNASSYTLASYIVDVQKGCFGDGLDNPRYTVLMNS